MHISDGVLAPSVLATGYVVAGGLTALGLRRIRDRDYPLVGIMTAAFFVASLVSVPAGPTSMHLTFNSLVGILLGARCFPAILVALFLQAALLGHGALTTLGVNTVIMAVPGYLAGAWMHWGLRRDSSGRVAFALVLLPVCAVAPKLLVDGLKSAGWVASTWSWPVALVAGLVVAGVLVALEAALRGGPVFRWGFVAGASGVLLAAAGLACVLALAPLDRWSEREAFSTLARFAFVAYAPIALLEGIMVALIVRYLSVTRPALLFGPAGRTIHPGAQHA